MSELNRFRGAIGQIGAETLHPRVFFKASLPTGIYIGNLLITLLGLYLLLQGFKLILQLSVLCWVVSFCYLVGRYAVPASQGLPPGAISDDEAGEVRRFTLRFLICSLALWGVGLLVSYLATRNSMPDMNELLLSSMTHDPYAESSGTSGPRFPSMHGLGVKTVILMALTMLAIPVLLPLTVIVALSAGDIRDLFRADLWLVPLLERTTDLFALSIALCGTLVMSYLLYVAPLVLLLSLLANVPGGVVLLVALMLMPLSVLTILLGRLCGAFVYHEGWVEEPEAEAEEAPSEVPAPLVPPPFARPVAASAAPAVPEAPATPRPAPERLAQIQARIDALSDAELAEWAQNLPGNDPARNLELALTLQRAGRRDAALDTLSVALRQTVTDGNAELGVEVARAFWNDRARVLTDAGVQETLGRHFLERGDYVPAAWCLHAAAAKTDGMRAQKALLEVANRASEAGQPKTALQLYEYMLKTYPQSSLRSLVEGSIELERRRMAG